MRTIQPGEQLVYRFTAERAGIWMYHCSTDPMSTHIAAGMHGAVVIEPADLPEVDRSYLLVQSEVYLANAAAAPAEAAEVDAGKVRAQTPDRVVFNGIANQYDEHPLPARPGARAVLGAERRAEPGGHPHHRWAVRHHLSGGGLRPVPRQGRLREHGQRRAGPGAASGTGRFRGAGVPGGRELPGGLARVMSDAEKGAHGMVAVADRP